MAIKKVFKLRTGHAAGSQTGESRALPKLSRAHDSAAYFNRNPPVPGMPQAGPKSSAIPLLLIPPVLLESVVAGSLIA